MSKMSIMDACFDHFGINLLTLTSWEEKLLQFHENFIFFHKYVITDDMTFSHN